MAGAGGLGSCPWTVAVLCPWQGQVLATACQLVGFSADQVPMSCSHMVWGSCRGPALAPMANGNLMGGREGKDGEAGGR